MNLWYWLQNWFYARQMAKGLAVNPEVSPSAQTESQIKPDLGNYRRSRSSHVAVSIQSLSTVMWPRRAANSKNHDKENTMRKEMNTEEKLLSYNSVKCADRSRSFSPSGSLIVPIYRCRLYLCKHHLLIVHWRGILVPQPEHFSQQM